MTHIRYPAVTCCDKQTSIITKSFRLPIGTSASCARYSSWQWSAEFQRDILVTVKVIIEYGSQSSSRKQYLCTCNIFLHITKSLKMPNLHDNPIKSEKRIRNSDHYQNKNTSCQSQQKLQGCYHEYLIFQCSSVSQIAIRKWITKSYSKMFNQLQQVY